MAFLIKNIFGGLTGSLGDNIFRSRYGKTVAYKKTVKQKISKSKASISARKQFALTVAFAKEIISFPELKNLWQKSKLPGTSAYHKIIKFNNRLTSKNNLTVKNKIIPHNGTEIIKDIIIKGNAIYIQLFDNQVLENYKFDVIVICCLYNKRFIIHKDFVIKSFDVSFTDKEITRDNTISVDANTFNFSRYKNVIVYCAIFASKDSSKNYYSYKKEFIL